MKIYSTVTNTNTLQAVTIINISDALGRCQIRRPVPLRELRPVLADV